MKKTRGILAAIIAFALSATICSCTIGNEEAHTLPNTLVVGTVYSPSGFFIMRGDTLGYDFDRISDFAKDKNINLKFKVAPNLNTLIGMLNDGQVDIIASEVPNSDEYRKQVINCGAINETRPVLVQHSGNMLIQDVTQLAGKDVYVEANSKYESLLNNINSELGGTINVHSLKQDSVSTDDLLDMVSSHKIAYTVVDSDIAQFNATYYDSIDVNLTIGMAQTSSWAVSPRNQWLADSIDAWSNSLNAMTYSKKALERYVKKSRIKEGERDLAHEVPHLGQRPSDRWNSITSHSGSSGYAGHSGGGIHSASSFDELFHKYAGPSGWDWRLLAAIARIESGYNSHAVSWAGARGLMQVMPGTARGYGVSSDQLFDVETNVRVAARCINDINKKLINRIPNRDERMKFVLASYNAGVGHVLDAMALAQKYGKNPHIWSGNVEEAMLWESNPQYYNDPVCKYGYCRGREPVNYVRAVQRVYYQLSR